MDGEKERAHGASSGVEAKAFREIHSKRLRQGHHRRMGFLSRSKPLVGLDIGSSGIKAVELVKLKKGYQLTGFAYEPLGPDSVVDGAIMDEPAVAESIKKTFLSGKFKPKGVCARARPRTARRR